MRWVAGVGLVVALGAPGHAQVASDELGIERFRLSIDRSGILDVDSADVPAHAAWSCGLALNFAHDPLVLYDEDKMPVESLVDRRLTTGLVGSIGLFERVQIGAGVDLVGYQRGSDVPTTGLGDARLVVKILVAKARGVAVSIVPALTVPAGSARGYLREDGITFAPALAVSAGERFRVAANVGYRFKPRVEIAGLVSDDEAFARAGVGARLAPAELWLSSSIAAPLTDRTSNQIAVEMMGGATRTLTSHVGIFAAAGVGLYSGFGTPDWRAVAGVRIEPPAPPKREVIVAVPLPPVPKVAVEPKPVIEAPALSKLGGRVIDPEGRPIPRATVTIEAPEGKLDVVADDTGRYSVEYKGGPVQITASAPQYQPNTVALDAGAATEADITLTRAVRQGQLRGQVLSFGGKPLAATITVTGKTTVTAQTDEEGRYTIDLPEGPFQVTIESAGHATQKRNVTVKLEGVTILNVDLRGAK